MRTSALQICVVSQCNFPQRQLQTFSLFCSKPIIKLLRCQSNDNCAFFLFFSQISTQSLSIHLTAWLRLVNCFLSLSIRRRCSNETVRSLTSLLITSLFIQPLCCGDGRPWGLSDSHAKQPAFQSLDAQANTILTFISTAWQISTHLTPHSEK